METVLQTGREENMLLFLRSLLAFRTADQRSREANKIMEETYN